MAALRVSAVQDFRRARRRAGLEKLLARVTGKSPELLAFDEVRQKLRAGSMIERGLQVIPLDAIVGSVGRYRDFSRSFLPLSDEDEGRWANVKVAQETTGTPPIIVYQVDEVYFVLDGNHRVSIARQMGNKTMEAYVTEVQVRVPFDATVRPDDLIMKAEYAEFLAQTRLDKLRPDGDLSLTAPGKYPMLLEHIQVHQYYLGLEQQRDVPYQEAVVSWYDNVYLPTVELIERSGLLYDFPERTSGDLYLWLTEHRARIEQSLQMRVAPTKAAADLKSQATEGGGAFGLGRNKRTGEAPVEVPKTKQEVERLTAMPGDHLFETILVPFSRAETSWTALDQAFTVAQREGGHVRGLLSLAAGEDADSLLVREFETAFSRRCGAAGVSGRLMLERKPLADAVQELARYVDLIVLRAPGGMPLEAGLQQIVQELPGPTLLLPDSATALQRVLLVYNGGWASRAALAAAGYVARCWQASLTVLVTPPDGKPEALLREVGEYLEGFGLTAELSIAAGNRQRAARETIAGGEFEMLLWGGSGKSATKLLKSGSKAANEAAIDLPLLLCN